MAVEDISRAVLAFNLAGVTELVQKEIDAGTDIDTILNEALIGAMDEVGKRFSDGELYVPEMLMAAQTMKAGLALLKPHLTGDSARAKGTVVIGTVKGDLHDIGKNLVAMMLEGAGFNVVDLGVDVAAETFVQAAGDNGAGVVALSALLTTTMPAMEGTIKALQEAGLTVKIMVGGAPVTSGFADRIGAQGFSADAPGAVELARKLMAAQGGSS
ncbi:MAG: corrinoid protein [Deltaproteobacteria bacterium]|nr:corrinoid protein [Deltaproteobacteria bacterium]